MPEHAEEDKKSSQPAASDKTSTNTSSGQQSSTDKTTASTRDATSEKSVKGEGGSQSQPQEPEAAGTEEDASQSQSSGIFGAIKSVFSTAANNTDTIAAAIPADAQEKVQDTMSSAQSSNDPSAEDKPDIPADAQKKLQEAMSTAKSQSSDPKDPNAKPGDLPPDAQKKIQEATQGTNPEQLAAHVSSVTGKSPDEIDKTVQGEIDKINSGEGSTMLQSAIGTVAGWVGAGTETSRPNAGGVPYEPLGNTQEHAENSTVVGYVGGVLGGVTRTAGGTAGALGTGVGETITTTAGGNKKEEPKEETAERAEEGGDGKEAQKKPRGVGETIRGGGQAIDDGTVWTARALENTTKGYPVQWQKITGDDRRL